MVSIDERIINSGATSSKHADLSGLICCSALRITDGEGGFKRLAGKIHNLSVPQRSFNTVFWLDLSLFCLLFTTTSSMLNVFVLFCLKRNLCHSRQLLFSLFCLVSTALYDNRTDVFYINTDRRISWAVLPGRYH